jgi:phosphorylcholine metabolism protein LicD
MERRELLKTIALLTGTAVVGGEFFLSGCKNPTTKKTAFTPAMIDLLDEVAETIIPTTDTPGAKAAKTGLFMQVMIDDCYTKEEQAAFIKGISELDQSCLQKNGTSFIKLNAEKREAFLKELEKEAKAFNENNRKKAEETGKKGPTPPPHYYSMMKQLTLWGFFSSETGMTKTLRHVPVPGRYDGNVPYTKGEKAWAE